MPERDPEERRLAREQREAARRARGPAQGQGAPAQAQRTAARAPRAPAAGAPPTRPSAQATRRLLDQRRARMGLDGGAAATSDRGTADTPQARADRAGQGGGPRGRGRETLYRRRRVAAAVAAAVALLGLWFVVSLFQPFKGAGHGEVEVTIPSGAGTGEIGDLLANEGVVSSAFFFELRARLSGSGADLKSGTFTLSEDMSYAEALEALSVGAPPTNVVQVTVPEGRARSEVAPIVEDAGLEGDYEEASKQSKVLDPADYGAEGADSLEGFLFPSTYELKRSDTAEDLVERQLETFKEEFAKVDMSEAKDANLTPYDVLIIASMVERETLVPEERALVASVIYNRLERGEPLFIDATIRFALDQWIQPLTESDLAVDSPYNTRLNAGLPPGPIGSPGRDSIEAAANPADTDFLFYVVKPGTCGEHVFTETIDEHEAAVAEYDAARAAAGYRSPTDCPE